MKNRLVFLIVTLMVQCLFAQSEPQVYINSAQHPTAVLAMNDSQKGFLLPKVALVDVFLEEPLESVIDGMMVYNVSTNVIGGEGKGIYMWIDDHWVRSGENSNTYIINDDKQTVGLGYLQNFQNSNKAEFTFTLSDKTEKTAFLIGNCVVNPVNKHRYCFYDIKNFGLKWEEAFHASQSVGGYLATITTVQEQQFIEQQLSSKNILNNIWLGMRKTMYSGLDNIDNSKLTPKVFAITGETFEMVWSNKPTVFHNFHSSKTNKIDGNQGCVLLLGDGLSDPESKRFTWESIDCKKNNHLGGADKSSGLMSYFIVEYDK